MSDLLRIDKRIIKELIDFPINTKEIKIENNFVIAGGYIRDSLIGEKYSDIDIFILKNDSDYNFEDINLKSLISIFDDSKTKLVFNSPKMKTYITNVLESPEKIQIIKSEHRTIEDLLESFDFTICQFAYSLTNKEDFLYCGQTSIADSFNRRLVFNKKYNGEFIGNSFERLQKYARKGFVACGGTIKDMIEKVRSVDQEIIDNNFSFYPNGGFRTNKVD